MALGMRQRGTLRTRKIDALLRISGRVSVSNSGDKKTNGLSFEQEIAGSFLERQENSLLQFPRDTYQQTQLSLRAFQQLEALVDVTFFLLSYLDLSFSGFSAREKRMTSGAGNPSFSQLCLSQAPLYPHKPSQSLLLSLAVLSYLLAAAAQVKSALQDFVHFQHSMTSLHLLLRTPSKF